MTSTRLRDQVAMIVTGLPEATSAGSPHLTLAVGRKTFGYFLDNHHGDGIVGVALKAAAGEQEALVRSDPKRFYVPAYVGSKGWVGVRLDVDPIDWDELRELITDAYRLQAPRRLAALLDD